MRHLTAVAFGLALLAGACGNATGEPSSAPVPATPAEELDAAVRSAAGALLDVPGATGAEFAYGNDDELVTTRWMQWSANGDMILVVAGANDRGGLVQVRGELMVASTGTEGDKPWAQEAPPLESRGDPGAAFNLDLPAMANGSVLRSLDGIAVGEVSVTSEITEDGETIWSLSNPLKGATATRVWRTDQGGVLRYYSLTTDADEPILGSFSWIETHFDPVAVADEIVLPQEGTALDLDALGLPALVPLPDP